MVWFYTAASGTVRVETRHDAASSEYVLQIDWPGRPAVIERFRDASGFEARVKELEVQLEQAGCTQLGDPEILPHGWRGPVTH